VATDRPTAVTNTSPIIALAGVDHLSLLAELFEKLIVPLDVWAELIDKPGAPEPAQVMALPNVAFFPAPAASEPPLPELPDRLHAGERAAIAIAWTSGARVLLDEADARKAARGHGLVVVGTLGILVEAKRTGLLKTIKPAIERMVENGNRFRPGLVASVLRAAGEEP